MLDGGEGLGSCRPGRFLWGIFEENAVEALLGDEVGLIFKLLHEIQTDTSDKLHRFGSALHVHNRRNKQICEYPKSLN
jgi:hypothetical protein